MIRDRISLPGIVAPWKELKVLAEIRGKVVKKNVKEGKYLKKNDIIAKIDARDFQNAYLSAKSSHKAAVASLKRIKELYKDQLSTRSQLDDAVARTQNLKSAMDNAALNLERCVIRAAMSGIVDRLYFEEGQYVKSGDMLAKMIRIDRVRVKVGIPESDVDAVRRLDTFQVQIDALAGRIFQGKKNFLSNTAEPSARLYELNLAIDNPKREILPDMFARVEIVKREVKDGISVPLYAIINRNNARIVYVVNDSEVHARSVEIGLMEGWRVEIKKGLKAGDQVIVVGQRDVNPGQGVKVVRTAETIEDLER
jgi:RND family efflux transporter MFP subunit